MKDLEVKVMTIKPCKFPEKFKSSNVPLFGIIYNPELEARPRTCKNRTRSAGP